MNPRAKRRDATATLTGREYLRVSLDKTGDEKSVNEQHAENQVCATGHGVALGEPYAETGSASRYARKVRGRFDQLVVDLEAGSFGADVLVLWEASRGSRQTHEWCRLIDACEKAGVRVLATTDDRVYDPARPTDRKSLLQGAIDSEFESGRLSVRLRRGQAGSAAAGRPASRPPYGYKRRYRINPETGKRELAGQVIVASEAKIVREIFTRIEKRESLRSIAADLTERKVPGCTWSPGRVRDLALLATYAGLRQHVAGRSEMTKAEARHAAVFYPATWKPIVRKEQFYAVRELLLDDSRRVSRPGRHKHLLSLIATCEACDGPVTARNIRGDYYICQQGSHVKILRADLDEYVTELVIARLSREDVWDSLAHGTDEADVQAARDHLAEVKAHHRELLAEAKARRISPAAFAALEPTALADIDSAERNLRELETPPALRALLGDPGKDIRIRWNDAPVVARREIVRTLFEAIAVQRVGPGNQVPAAQRTTIMWRGQR